MGSKNVGRGENLALRSSANDAWGENEAELDGGRKKRDDLSGTNKCSSTKRHKRKKL